MEEFLQLGPVDGFLGLNIFPTLGGFNLLKFREYPEFRIDK